MAKKSMLPVPVLLRNKKTACHVCIVILLICTTVYSNWILFHQQMSSISTMTTTTNEGFDVSSTKEEKRYGISWEWKRYSSTSTGTSTTVDNATQNTYYNTPKILIAQYDAGGSGGDDTSSVPNNSSHNNSYSMLLNITSRINQLYAHQYQLDYVLLRGIVFRTFYESVVPARTQIPSSRATYSKVYIVQKAIEWEYDYLLLFGTLLLSSPPTPASYCAMSIFGVLLLLLY